MLKKLSIVFVFGLAYAVILGHSIVPHHHDDDDNLVAHHQTSPHSNNTDGEKEDLADLFAHFLHYDKEDFSYLKTEKQEVKLSPAYPFSHTDIRFDMFVKHSVRKYLIPEKPNCYLSPILAATSLRGPPALV